MGRGTEGLLADGGGAVPGMLKRGLMVQGETSGSACVVTEYLGGGGQGEVYRAEMLGREVALKWYFPHTATREQRAALELLVRRGPPSPKFLWPVEMTSAPGVPGYGYVMALRPPTYKGIMDLMRRRIEPSFRALASAGLELANSYLQLHARGLCYRDISFGNAFFDPATGDVLICDNDNVSVNGDTNSGVLGTPRFMAPEVVRGEVMPSTETDLFSLAVLLFYMFTLGHPLDGANEAAIRVLDFPALVQLYGNNPVFIFDPDNDSNRPVPGRHQIVLDFWPIYPRFLRDLFTRAFTAGLRDPKQGRVRENQWRAAMARLRDAIFYCGGCGAENFFDEPASAGSDVPVCWSCQAALQPPPRIHIGKHVVMLTHDARLYPHHVDDRRLYDFSAPVAEVAPHPARPAIWGLRNCSEETWRAITRNGVAHAVPQGKSVTLAEGTSIQLGRAAAELRV